jgi:hypothetical protein
LNKWIQVYNEVPLLSQSQPFLELEISQRWGTLINTIPVISPALSECSEFRIFAQKKKKENQDCHANTDNFNVINQAIIHLDNMYNMF